MTEEKKNATTIESEFESLPLGEKVSVLFRLEVKAVSEAIEYAGREAKTFIEQAMETFSTFMKENGSQPKTEKTPPASTEQSEGPASTEETGG